MARDETPNPLRLALELMTSQLERRGFKRQDIAVAMTEFGISLGSEGRDLRIRIGEPDEHSFDIAIADAAKHRRKTSMN